jgi:hypothetical protein
MYKTGDLDRTQPLCAFAKKEEEEHDDTVGYCWDCESSHSFTDSRGSLGDVRHPAVALPHSCDAWVIGGLEEVLALIKDLQAWAQKLASEAQEKKGREG